jgi:hypothetical protein
VRAMAAAVLLFLMALALLAPRFGADSRDGRDWQSRQRGRPW